MFKLLHLLN